MKKKPVVILGLASLLLLVGAVRADENENTLDPTIAKEIPVDGFPKVTLKHSIMLQRNGAAVRAASPNETFIAVWGDQKKGIVYLLDEDDPDNNEPYAIPLDEIVKKAGADQFFTDLLTAAETSQYGNVISVADNALKVDPNNILFFNFKSKAAAVYQSQCDIVALQKAIEQGKAQADQAHKNASVIGGKHPYNWDDYTQNVNSINQLLTNEGELRRKVTDELTPQLKTSKTNLETAKKDFTDFTEKVVLASRFKHDMATKAAALAVNPRPVAQEPSPSAQADSSPKQAQR